MSRCHGHLKKVRLTKSAKDLAQRGGGGLRRISREEVAQHDSIHDAWMILKGKVYNIGPYLHYHPGGITILKSVLGKDATELFDKYHPWVNIDGYVVDVKQCNMRLLLYSCVACRRGISLTRQSPTFLLQFDCNIAVGLCR